jgi:hypothetical protein
MLVWNWNTALSIAAVIAAFAGFGYSIAVNWDSDRQFCLRMYAAARTATDSAEVDAFLLARKGGVHPSYSCGAFRRQGRLGLDRNGRHLPGQLRATNDGTR